MLDIVMDWLRRYPSVRIEDIGTRYENGVEPGDIAEFDYIIVGGCYPRLSD